MPEVTLEEHLHEVKDHEVANLISEIARMSIDIRAEFPQRMAAKKGEENKYGEMA